MTENRVGIVIPTYNSRHFVTEAAESALECLGTMSNIVIVDDGSAHRGSRHELDRLRARGFDVQRQENAGVSAARNHGLSQLATPYAFVLDSDDLIEPGAASIAADYLDDCQDVAIVTGSGIDFTDAEDLDSSAAVSPGNLTRDDMWRSTLIATASAFRVADWRRCGGFPEGVVIGEDWVFWLRLLSGGGRILTSDAVFVRHRLHAGQTTRRAIDPRELAKASNLAIRENPDLAASHLDEVIEDLCASRAALAAYRHAYRFIDRAKTPARELVKAGRRLRGSH